MKNSLELACEKFFIQTYAKEPRLSGKSIVHFDNEATAATNAIVVQAKQGNHNLAGPGGYDIEVTVEHRSPAKSTKNENDIIAAAIREAIYDSKLAPAAWANMARKCGLKSLLVKDETTGERQNNPDLRKRIITFPLQAAAA